MTTITTPQYTLYNGDCRDFMCGMEAGSVVTVTDPPYGADKADWDKEFPAWFYELVKPLSFRVCIITGSAGLKDSVACVGGDFVDVIAARNLNALTRGPLGFSNWLACVLTGDKPKQMPNFFEFAVVGDMPDHPSPKPIQYMLKLLERVTEKDDVIFDPFMGSGTTGVAALQLGRRFIGCELDAGYFAIAQRRIENAAAQPLLLPTQLEKAEQLGLTE